MKILVLNCGSSSLKFRLFNMDTEKELAGGFVERIGTKDVDFEYRTAEGEKIKELIETQPIKDHHQAIDIVLKVLCNMDHGILKDIREIDAVGHRVVHGGDQFTESVLINEKVYLKIKDCIRFAPLHNPPNIKGIDASLWLIPFARQVAVFDTAFHQTIESHVYIYGLPIEWYKKKRIRRYGFHGTSHQYVAHQVAKTIRKPIEYLKIITCHLGNGASITAVDGGKSVETSMGFTPLEGLVMGTRCGNIDPAIPIQIMEEEGLTPSQMDSILNKKSGLLGITDGDSDMRIIEEKAEEGSEKHKLALKIFAHHVKKYIGAYAAVMGGLDALVFTAGIGEKSSSIREMSCNGLEFLGIEIDPEKNLNNETFIGKGNINILIIPTNEELAIAKEVMLLFANDKNIQNRGVPNHEN